MLFSGFWGTSLNSPFHSKHFDCFDYTPAGKGGGTIRHI